MRCLFGQFCLGNFDPTPSVIWALFPYPFLWTMFYRRNYCNDHFPFSLISMFVPTIALMLQLLQVTITALTINSLNLFTMLKKNSLKMFSVHVLGIKTFALIFSNFAFLKNQSQFLNSLCEIMCQGTVFSYFCQIAFLKFAFFLAFSHSAMLDIIKSGAVSGG